MRHRFDPWSLLFALVFGAVAIAGMNGWLADLWVDDDLWTLEVVVPAALIALGLAIGLAALAMLRGRADPVEPSDGTVGASPVDDRPPVDR